MLSGFLKDNSQSLQAFEALAGIGHWVLDLDSNHLFWSQEVYDIHGLCPNGYKPSLDSAVEFYHQNDRQRVEDAIGYAIKQGDSFQFELRIVRRDSAIRFVRAKGECEVDNDGKVVSVFGIFQDITGDVEKEQKRQQELFQAKERYDLSVAGASVGLWDWDITRDTLYWSPRFLEIIGISDARYEATFSEFQRRLHPEDEPRVVAAVTTHLEKKQAYYIDYRLLHEKGHYVWIHARGQAIWDDEGNPVRMAGSIDDISINKKTATALKETLDFQSLLMRVNPDYIFVKDSEFRIVEANPAFLSFYPPEKRNKVIGYTTLEDYSPDQADEFLVEDKKAFKDGESEIIETIDFPDGVRRVLLTKKIRFENAEKQAFILGIARDITDIKQAQDELQQANEELEEFSYRTSHDLRSPLVSSLGLLDLIEKKIEVSDFDTVKISIDIIRRSIKKLDSLVLDILALTKAKNTEEEKKNVMVYQTVDDIMEKFAYMQGVDRITFYNEVGRSLEVNVKPSRFVLILENLISNAIKYADSKKPDSFVKVESKIVADKLILSVTDNGLGVPHGQHQKLFSMFKRFHPKVSFGSGLGLYMVKKSADIMGSTIQYRAMSSGSSFVLTMPYSPSV